MLDFKRIFNLISKTKDKCIVHDEELGDYVVFTLEDYEKLVLGSQKNNKQKPVASNEKPPKKESEEEQGTPEDWTAMEDELEGEGGEDRYYFEPVGDEE